MESPLTVSESQDNCVPRSLESVICSLQDVVGIPTRNQLISGLFYVLMQESGYVLKQPIGCDDTGLKDIKGCDGSERRTMTFNLSRLLSEAPLVVPLLKSSSGNYKLPLQLVGVPDYRFMLLISPTADDIIVVNLLVTKDSFSDCFSIVLRVSTFVPNPKSDNIANRFCDLRTLSLIFKDNIAHKGRSAVLNCEGVVNNSLIGLMDEIKQKIVTALPVQDFLNLASTCQALLSLKRDKTVWKTLLLRDFSYKVPEEEDQSAENLIKVYRKLKTKNHNNNALVDETFYDYFRYRQAAVKPPMVGGDRSIRFRRRFQL